MSAEVKSIPKKGSLLALISWAFYDWANSSFSVIIETFVLPAYFVKMVVTNEAIGVEEWGFALGMSGLVIAFGGPILGAIADQGGHRKRWIFGFTSLNVICCSLMWYIMPHNHDEIYALILFSFAVIGSEFAYVFYNSMLPDLVDSQRIGRWSGWGWGLGYIGGMIALSIALVFFITPETALFNFNRNNAEEIRASFLLTALWFIVFSLPLFLFTPSTPGKKPILSAVISGLKQLGSTLKQLKHYGHLYRFFIARMFFTDGLLTLFAFGGIYAAARFDMSEAHILLFGIVLNVSAGIGAFLLALLDDHVGPKKLMIASLFCLIIIGLCAIFSQTEAQFWISGMLLGIFVGPVQASSRSYLAKEAPPELMAQMFGFFTLSGKATSFMGPLVVSWTVATTGSLLLGMTSIIIFFIIGLTLLLTVKEPGKV